MEVTGRFAHLVGEPHLAPGFVCEPLTERRRARCVVPPDVLSNVTMEALVPDFEEKTRAATSQRFG